MNLKYDFNISEVDASKAKYLQKLSIKRMQLPTGVTKKLITQGNIITVGDLLETSSLELFNILGCDYCLYKDTKEAFKNYGIELFSHTSAQAQKVKNSYHHLSFINKNDVKSRESFKLSTEEDEIQF